MDWVTIVVDIGEKAFPWVATFAVGIVAKYLVAKLKSDYWQGVLNRATQEMFDSALEVHQTYVSAIKKAREDGELSESEKRTAAQMAMDTFKQNLGPKGFSKLVKVFGGVAPAETWAKTKMEKAVLSIKQPANP